MINWAHFPQSVSPSELDRKLIDVFEAHASAIDSSTHVAQVSDVVLAHLAGDLLALGFRVETGKTKAQKVHVPVLYGRNGKVEKSFEADAYHPTEGYVLEVEAGRGVTNYQFLKDLFQACMMEGVTRLAIAVRNVYRKSADFDRMFTFFDTLYKSNRLALPLDGILTIGY